MNVWICMLIWLTIEFVLSIIEINLCSLSISHLLARYGGPQNTIDGSFG